MKVKSVKIYILILEKVDYKVAQELLKLQAKVMKAKKEMENILIESEVNWLVIVFNGNMDCMSVYDEKDINTPRKIHWDILKAINKWIKEVNKQMREKMQEIEKSYKHLLPKQEK